MELTKEQIKYIDNRLEENGVKYWDIRVEMLDHIVSDIEINAKSNDFKVELENSLRRIGWFGNLIIENRKGWQNVNKYYRKIYFKGFIDFFKKPLNLLYLLLVLIIYFFISKNVSHHLFLKISYFVFISPIVIYFISFYKTYKKKLGKSAHKDYGLNYMFLSFLILNAIIQFVRVKDGFPIEYHKMILFFIMPVHFIFTFSGYQVYKKAISKVEKMKKELLS